MTLQLAEQHCGHARGPVGCGCLTPPLERDLHRQAAQLDVEAA